MPLPTKTDLKKLVKKNSNPVKLYKIDNVFRDELVNYPEEIQSCYVYNVESRTYTLMETEWLKWRQHGPYYKHPEDSRYIDITLGGSDIAALFDGSDLEQSLYLYPGQHGSNFKSAIELYHQKIGDELPLKEKISSDILWVGHNEEASIRSIFRKKYADDHPMDIVEVINDCHMWQCGERSSTGQLLYPFVLCDLDGLVKINGTVGILECKTCNIGSEDFKIWKAGNVPLKYYLQCCWYMLCMNVPYAYICVKWGLSLTESDYFYIERNLQVEEMILDMAFSFIYCVNTKTPPALENQNPERIFLYWRKKMGPTVENEPPVILPSEYADVLMQLSFLNDEIKASSQSVTDTTKERNKLLTDKIFPVMGNSNMAIVPYKADSELCISVKDSANRASKIDIEKLREDEPDLYKNYLYTSEIFNEKLFCKELPSIAEEYLIQDDTLTESKKNYCKVWLRKKYDQNRTQTGITTGNETD